MQPVVHAVFIVVVSVIATLLTLGLSGILAILAMDRTAPAHSAEGTERRRSVATGRHSVGAVATPHAAVGASA